MVDGVLTEHIPLDLSLSDTSGTETLTPSVLTFSHPYNGKRKPAIQATPLKMGRGVLR